MNTINRHIEYLVLRHDCVVIPGIGAVIGRHVPSRYDASSGTLLPPCRELGFNPRLTQSDGLLAASVARSLGISTGEAADIVAGECTAMGLQLETVGEVALGRIGTLCRNAEGRLEFLPAQGMCVAPRLVGLAPVAPVGVPGVAELPAPRVSPLRRAAVRTLRVAASIAVAVSLGLVLSTPVADHGAQLASLGRSFVDTRTASEAAVTAKPQTLCIALPDASAATAVATLRPASAESAPDTKPAEYYLIVASLPSRVQAERFMATQPDSASLGVVYSGSRYRVYAASGSTYARALEGKTPAIEARFPDAWVCRP